MRVVGGQIQGMLKKPPAAFLGFAGAARQT